MDDAVTNYLRAFNEAVRRGDWAMLAGAHAKDAVVEFAGVPVPTMRGRAAIEAGYRANPPDDQITALACRSDGDTHEVLFRWNVDGTGGGRLRVTMRDGLVAHKVVTPLPEVPVAAADDGHA